MYRKKIEFFDDYQEFTKTTSAQGTNPQWDMYLFEGLISEIGEVFGKLKRTIRGDYELTDKVRKEIGMELGDVMWYLMQILYLYRRNPSHYIPNEIIKFSDQHKDRINNRLVHQNAMILYSVSANFIDMITRGRRHFSQIQSTFVMLSSLIALISSQLGLELYDVINWNVNKLSARKKANTIKGTGDGIKGRRRKKNAVQAAIKKSERKK